MAGREDKKLRFKEDKILTMVYLEDNNFTLLEKMIMLKSLVVAFNRTKGGTDLSHELVLRVPNVPKDIDSKLVNQKTTDCLIKLVKENQKQ